MNDNEYEISKMISDLNMEGFPKVYSQGLIQNQPYIIMEKLGLSLKDILKRNKRHFSVKCILTIGIKLIMLMQKLHDTGYIHCDIKPDNIMIGDYTYDTKLRNKLYLIDFGIAQKYVDENNEHLPLLTGIPFKGNVIFSSKNAFNQ